MATTETAEETPPGREFMSAIKRRRAQDRKEWAAYWEIRRKEAENSFVGTYVYYMNRFVNGPVTWFRENIVEPLHDKHKMPYYHRKISRVPEIDECGVNDHVSLYETEEQFRLDKLVDHYIRDILYTRFQQCIMYNGYDNIYHCAKQADDFQNADLNFFIKYGELGSEQTVVACYMKQKHRLIWERRHPEIMEERKRACMEHEENLRNGKFNIYFWEKNGFLRKKQDYPPAGIFGPNWDNIKIPTEGDHAISRDWRYYQKLEEDPNFDIANYSKKLNKIAEAAKEAKQKKMAVKNGNGATNGNGTSTKENNIVNGANDEH